MTKPRVRFAPSPTGYLHIGGVRTALFNWLWARKTGGTFVLRVEDTDQERSTRASVEAIFDAMRWLGLDWDEGPRDPDDDGGGPHGPYFQMKRLGLYREHADKLIRAGKAYRCYHSEQDLDEEKSKLSGKARVGFRHQCPWRDKPEELDRPHVVRFKTPLEGAVTFRDKVFGEITTPNDAQTDFVLLRSDGVPLYNFGAVVDDATMGITLVARGRDHIVNTPPQVLLYDALGYPAPEFAHLTMLMANKKEKLSKRNGSVSVSEYQGKGWSPGGLLSYLVRFGWSHGDQELFTRKELVEAFDWEHVGRSDGIYDMRKCAAINAQFVMQHAPADEAARAVAPFLRARGLAVRDDHPRLPKAVDTVRARCEVKVPPPSKDPAAPPPELPPGPFAVMADAADFYFRAAPVMDPAARAKNLTPEAADTLDALASVAAERAAEPFGVDEVKSAVEAWLAERGLEIKHVAQPARVALTGRAASPGLYEVMAVLGREVSALRLRAGAALARTPVVPGGGA